MTSKSPSSGIVDMKLCTDVLRSAESKEKSEYVPDILKSCNTCLVTEVFLRKPLVEIENTSVPGKTECDSVSKPEIGNSILFTSKNNKLTLTLRSQVQAATNRIVKEVRSNFGKWPVQDLKNGRTFCQHLNSTGIYLKCKAELKPVIIMAIKEGFRQSALFTEEDVQKLVSETYVQLVDVVHSTLHDLFVIPNADIGTMDISHELESLLQMAEAEEQAGKIASAKAYHEERLSKAGDNLQVWLDYAYFCIRSGFAVRAEECLKEILLRDRKHLPSLLVYGVLCTIKEQYELAEELLLAAYEVSKSSILVVTLLALFYDFIGKEAHYESSLKEAMKLASLNESDESVFLLTAVFLLRFNACQFVEGALAKELVINGPSIKLYILLSKLYVIRGDIMTAENHLKAAHMLDRADPTVWTELGNLYFNQKKFEDAKSAYEKVLAIGVDTKELHTVYHRLALSLIQSVPNDGPDITPTTREILHKAKGLYHKSCELQSSSQAWLGIAKAAIALGDCDNAHDA